MNKKLILNTLVFQVIGAIAFALTYLLTFFDIINKNDTLLNVIIFVVTAAACILWYVFVNKKYCSSVGAKDCALLLIMATVFYAPMILMSLNLAGIHLSVAVLFMCPVLLIFANNTIRILQQKYDLAHNKNLAYDKNKDYTCFILIFIILYLKFWRISLFLVPFLFGGVNIFFPFDFTLFNLH